MFFRKNARESKLVTKFRQEKTNNKPFFNNEHCPLFLMQKMSSKSVCVCGVCVCVCEREEEEKVKMKMPRVFPFLDAI